MGYHVMSVLPGYDFGYPNVMADPVCERRIKNDHEWLLE
jgi:5-deoxy-D-glucuronate isomerase